MLEFKTAFIDPATLLGKKPAAAPAVAGFVPTIQKVVELGPSAPHVDEGAELLAALSPGSPPSPPSMGAHYTDVLDELWPSFDEPDERTAARLRVLFDETVKVAGQMNTISIDFFDRVPFSKISLADRTRFHKEFIEYLRRLNEYRKRVRSGAGGPGGDDGSGDEGDAAAEAGAAVRRRQRVRQDVVTSSEEE